jgi:hypothetical protein
MGAEMQKAWKSCKKLMIRLRLAFLPVQRAKDYLPEESKEPVSPYHAGSLYVRVLIGA